MHIGPAEHDAKVAVLVDCENADPDILDHASKVAAQFGRVVLRRGYGGQTALANKWQAVLVQQAFTPCLQYPYASAKNTSDIALAIDALEAPAALRNASDQFFEWARPEPVAAAPAAPATSKAPAPPAPKSRPKSIVTAVKLLAADSPDGRVHVGGLGAYLRRTDPSFSPQTHGHTGLVDMLTTYDLLNLRQEPGGHWTVAIAAPAEAAARAAPTE